MKKKGWTQLEKKRTIYSVILCVNALLFIGAITLLEGFSEGEEIWTDYAFLSSLVVTCLTGILCVITIILFSRLLKKQNHFLNEALGKEIEYLELFPCEDLLLDANYPLDKKLNYFGNSGIQTKIEDLEVEYVHVLIENDHVFFSKNKKYLDLFVFKNIGIFQQNLWVSVSSLSHLPEEFKLYRENDLYIYAKQEEKWEGLRLPAKAIFLAITHQNMYILLDAETNEYYKKDVKDMEEFKKKVSEFLEDIKGLYEEAKVWFK